MSQKHYLEESTKGVVYGADLTEQEFQEIDRDVGELIGCPGLSFHNDLVAAWKIVDWIRTSGRFCCLKIGSDYHYCWRIEVVEEDEEKHIPYVIVDAVEDFCVAISLVAAKIKEKDDNRKQSEGQNEPVCG